MIADILSHSQSQSGHFCLLKRVSGQDNVTFMCTPPFPNGIPFAAVGSLADGGLEFQWFLCVNITISVTGC